MHKLYDSIKQGMEEAIAHSCNEPGEMRVYCPRQVDVKAVRNKTGLSQDRFASTFGISVATLRHWERGDRKPHGPALVLLNAADNDPLGLLKILMSSKGLSGRED